MLTLLAYALLAPGLLLAPAGELSIEPPEPPKVDVPHWRVRNALQGRNNQIGLGMNTRLSYRMPLYPGSKNILLKGSYVDVGGIARISPASLHHGLYVEAVPIAPLQFRFGIGRLAYFGLFGTVIEYPSPDADWSPQALKDNQPMARPGGGLVWRAMGKLRLKFGPVVVLHEQLVVGLRMDALDTGSYWYEPINDMLVGQRDHIWVMKNTLGYLVYGDTSREFLVIGAHHERYQTFKTDLRRQIVGAVSLYRPRYDWWGHPAFALLAGAMVEDVYRQGSLYIGGQIITTFDLY
ncbi:MAG: hypothetical protein ACI9U2_002580 [Bradymonadia bacterium]